MKEEDAPGGVQIKDEKPDADVGPVEGAVAESGGQGPDVKTEKTEQDVKMEPLEGVKTEQPEPSDEDIAAKLRSMLPEVDLNTTTERSLRLSLEAHFGCELKSRKALISQEVDAYLQSTAPPEEEEPEPATTSSKRGGSGFGKVFLSKALQDVVGEESMPRSQVVKQLWVYIRAHNLQNPKDKRQIMLDDKLKKLFKPPVNMFNMNKQLTKHIHTSAQCVDQGDGGSGSGSDEPKKRSQKKKPAKRKARGSDSDEEEAESSEEEESDEEARPAPAKKKPTPARQRAKSAGGTPAGGTPRASGFTKEMQLSDRLAAFVGQPSMSRPDLVKFMWQYFKGKELQDPSNKSFIRSDDALYELVKVKRFKAFGMMKLLAKHLKPSDGRGDDEEPEEEDE